MSEGDPITTELAQSTAESDTSMQTTESTQNQTSGKEEATTSEPSPTTAAAPAGEAASTSTSSTDAASDAAAASSSSSSASVTSSAPVPSTPAPTAALPTIPDDQLTPDQLRAKKIFERLQRAFLGAVDKQSEEYFIAMLREGEDLIQDGLLDLNRSIKPASGSTFLHTVAWYQKAKVMEWLLNHGANPNQGNLKGNTPLHLLCEQANKDIAPQLIQLMVDYGGDVHLKDGGETPQSSVEKAAAVGFDVMKLDFRRGQEFLAKRDGRGKEGTDGSGAAGGGVGSSDDKSHAGSGMTEAERTAAIDKSKLVYRKLSTLFLGLEAEGVSQAVDDAIIRILKANMQLMSGKFLDITQAPLASEGNMKTFLHYAVIARRPEIVKVLLLACLNMGDTQTHGLDVPDESGDTPLHYAIHLINAGDHGPSIVSQLLDAGASVHVTNYLKGLTPIQMLPPETTPEVRNWLKEQVGKPKPQKLTSNTLASKLLGQGGASNPIAPTVGMSSLSVPPSPSIGSHGAPSPTGADKPDRRALINRMASVGSGGMLTGGAGVGIGVGAPKSSALGLIQKAAHSVVASQAVGVGSTSATLSGALQHIMAAKNGGNVNATAGSTLPMKRVGLGGGSGGMKKLLNEKSLNLDDIFAMLDLSETNTITPTQLVALHEEFHSCGNSSLTLVQQVLDQVIPIGQCTRTNMLEVLTSMEVLCQQQNSLRWDFRLFDVNAIGSLSTMDGTGGFAFSPAELVWTVNQADSSQTKYGDFMTRKLRQEKSKPKEVKFNEMSQELASKLPNF